MTTNKPTKLPAEICLLYRQVFHVSVSYIYCLYLAFRDTFILSIVGDRVTTVTIPTVSLSTGLCSASFPSPRPHNFPLHFVQENPQSALLPHKNQLVKVKQSLYTPWRCLGGEKV
jgi:hypothetical protein